MPTRWLFLVCGVGSLVLELDFLGESQSLAVSGVGIRTTALQGPSGLGAWAFVAPYRVGGVYLGVSR